MILEAFFDINTLAKAFPEEYSPIQPGVSILDNEASTKDIALESETDNPNICRCCHAKSVTHLPQKL